MDNISIRKGHDGFQSASERVLKEDPRYMQEPLEGLRKALDIEAVEKARAEIAAKNKMAAPTAGGNSPDEYLEDAHWEALEAGLKNLEKETEMLK